MSVRQRRGKQWFYRTMVRLPDGRRERIFGVPKTFGLPNTRVGAQEAERRAVAAALGPKAQSAQTKEVPTIKEFSTHFMEVATAQNRPSSVDSKRVILDRHILPHLGDRKLDAVRYAEVQDLKLKLLGRGLGPKTVNNVLTVLRRMLEIARKRELIAGVPDMEWLKSPRPEFDFLTFEEAERLVVAGRDEWQTMILVALRTGLRQGELLGLRWEDVDLVAGRITVRRNIVRGRVGPPKSGKPREVPLSPETLGSLKSHRHLRGELVFCDLGGRPLTKGRVQAPALEHVQAGRSPAHRLARPAAHVRQPPGYAWRAAQGGPGAARPRDHHDDDALRAPGTRSGARCRASARYSAWHQRGSRGPNWA